VATTLGDASERLVVLVDEGTRMVVDIADRDTRPSVSVPQAAEPVAGEDGGDRGAGMPEERADPMRPPSPLDPRGQDGLDLLGRGPAWRVMGPRAAILEPGPALGPIPG
jgi:hypothetical protein